MSTPKRSPRHDGFTIVELLVAMTVSLAVLLAILTSLDMLSSSAARQTRATDANDQVRTTMDRTVTDLRGASTLLRASATDLVYTVPDTAGVRTERLCVSSDGLYASTSMSATMPAAPSAACSSATKIAAVQSTSSTGFTYDGASSSSTPALVKNVGLTFSLDSRGGGAPATSTLTASAARRSAAALLITDSDLHVSCKTGGGALLTLDASVPGLAGLSVIWTGSSGSTLGTTTGSASLSVASDVAGGLTSVTATVTDALGVTNVLQKAITCDA